MGWYGYGFRWYDPAIARFVSVDPLAEDFPHNATYAYAENRPISGVDLEGLEFFFAAGNTFMMSNTTTTSLSAGQLARVSVSRSLGQTGRVLGRTGRQALNQTRNAVENTAPRGVTVEPMPTGVEGVTLDGESGGMSGSFDMPLPEAVSDATQTDIIRPLQSEGDNALGSEDNPHATDRAARRDAMRQDGIPTSQQPDSQMDSEGGRQLEYTVPRQGGGTKKK